VVEEGAAEGDAVVAAVGDDIHVTATEPI
jgi:hypothetical protein